MIVDNGKIITWVFNRYELSPLYRHLTRNSLYFVFNFFECVKLLVNNRLLPNMYTFSWFQTKRWEKHIIHSHDSHLFNWFDQGKVDSNKLISIDLRKRFDHIRVIKKRERYRQLRFSDNWNQKPWHTKNRYVKKGPTSDWGSFSLFHVKETLLNRLHLRHCMCVC